MDDEHVPVLVVGAGPVGLCTAVFLARRGIKPLVVEKRESTSRLPRAPGLQARTMELFRVAGLSADIRALEIGDTRLDFEASVLRVSTFSESDDAVVLGRPATGGPTISPEQVMACGQDRYERVLLNKATEYGAEVRFSTWLVSFTQGLPGTWWCSMTWSAPTSSFPCSPLAPAARSWWRAGGGGRVRRTPQWSTWRRCVPATCTRC